MDQEGWRHFLITLERTYYTQIIVLLLSFFLLYVILRNYHKKKFACLFLIYSISCIILFAGIPIHWLFFPVKGRVSTVILESANTFFAISELCVFVTFFLKIVDSKNSKRLIWVFLGAFIISIIMFGAKVLNINSDRSEMVKASIAVNIVEFLIFLIAILSYFMELFSKPPTKDLGRSPAFWISSGLFIYILASLPLLLFGEYIWIEGKSLYFLLFSFHFLSLSLLLITICKAFLCPEPLTS